MFYWNNLPAWERGTRLVAALATGACAYHYWGGPAGMVFAVVSVSSALTAVVGFCPMCALAGRRLRARAKAHAKD